MAKWSIKRMILALVGLAGISAFYSIITGWDAFVAMVWLMSVSTMLLAIGGLSWGFVAVTGKDLLSTIGLK